MAFGFEFGEKLANLRRSKGLSQEQLAEELGLTRQTISKWELDQSTPDIEYIAKLSTFFEVSTDYLIKGTDESTPKADSKAADSAYLQNEYASAVSGVIAYRWCFYLGIVLTAISFIGIIIFVVLSAQNPWAAYVNGYNFEGLLGYLIGTETLWFFILLVLTLLAGLAVACFGIVKFIKTFKKMVSAPTATFKVK